jgi:AraC family transcriptional regulator
MWREINKSQLFCIHIVIFFIMKRIPLKPSGNHTVKKQEFKGLLISEAQYPARLKQPRHTHEFASFSFVLTGSYVENYERQAQTRQPSTIVFHPPQESHSVDFQSETVRILNVRVDSKRLADIREHSSILDSSSVCRAETTAWLGNRIYQEFRRMDALSSLAIEGLVLEILAQASRDKINLPERKSPRWLEQAKDFLHSHFSESIVLENIAQAVGVHPVHLTRVFRQNYGCTIGEYVRRLRLEFACRQISKTDSPLVEIAHAAGFSDQSHLNKTFKDTYGFTPSEYRKISRNRFSL